MSVIGTILVVNVVVVAVDVDTVFQQHACVLQAVVVSLLVHIVVVVLTKMEN